MKKIAMCVGINYVATEYELRGCINDADDWGQLLSKNGCSVSILPERQATKRNIVHGMQHLIAELKPGDVGFITYSGHGTWVPDKDGDEPDGRDEALCPIDMGDDGKNLLIDDEIHVLFNAIVPGAHVVFITDSCHSGTVYRMMLPGGTSGYRRPRFVPPSHFMKEDALVSSMNRAFGQPITKTDAPLPGVVHFSGCRDNEYSNDANIDGRACGAFSYYATRVFADMVKHGKTYSDAHKAIRTKLPNWDFQQTPLLNALPLLKKTKVLG